MKTLLQLSGIRKSFGLVRALKGVSFALVEGEVHALLGENGAGKSTLIKVISGAHRPDAGKIEFGGEEISDLTPAKAHALGIACIYQQPALFPDLSVAENIGLRLEKSGMAGCVRWKQWRKNAQKILSRLGADISPDTEAGSLSMPQQQLVEIACALGAGAKIVIMDEPTASLTQKEQHLLYKVVRDLRNEGVCVVYISHRLEEIFELADRVTILRDGESLGTHPVDGLSESQMIRWMVGRNVETVYPPTEHGLGRIVLDVKGLSCAQGGIDEVSFQIKAGEVFGLAGLVGAGRTELARVLFGITPADRGSIHLNGKFMKIGSPQEAIANGIAYVPEDRRKHGVVPEMTVAENMTLASHKRWFKAGIISSARESEAAHGLIHALGVKLAGPSAAGGSLSGGNQQKVSVARWLATEPKLLILDEPTQGVDIGAKSEIHRMVRDLAKQGLAVLMISSDLGEVLGMSDRIGVMRGGRLVQTYEQASAEQIIAAAMGSGEVRA